MAFLSQDYIDLGFTLVKQINPLEAIVKSKNGGLMLAYKQTEDDESATIAGRPIVHHDYTIKTDDRDGINLFIIGFQSIGGTGTVRHGRYVTVHEKYALDCDVVTPPTEEMVEAVAGVLKCIKMKPFCQPKPWRYQDGELYGE